MGSPEGGEGELDLNCGENEKKLKMKNRAQWDRQKEGEVSWI